MAPSKTWKMQERTIGKALLDACGPPEDQDDLMRLITSTGRTGAATETEFDLAAGRVDQGVGVLGECKRRKGLGAWLQTALLKIVGRAGTYGRVPIIILGLTDEVAQWTSDPVMVKKFGEAKAKRYRVPRNWALVPADVLIELLAERRQARAGAISPEAAATLLGAVSPEEVATRQGFGAFALTEAEVDELWNEIREGRTK